MTARDRAPIEMTARDRAPIEMTARDRAPIEPSRTAPIKPAAMLPIDGAPRQRELSLAAVIILRKNAGSVCC